MLGKLPHRGDSLLQRLLSTFACSIRRSSSSSSSGSLSSSASSCPAATIDEADEHEEGNEGGVQQHVKKKGPVQWMVLPPAPRLSLLAQVAGQDKQLTALKWVTKCCPDLSHSVIERLFRLRQVKLCLQVLETNDEGLSRLKRIARKEIVPESAVIHLPQSVYLLIDSKESSSRAGNDNVQATEHLGHNKKEYKPSLKDIEWAQEFILHKDAHIIAINKPSGLAVQGGVGVGRNLDALLGPAFSFGSEEVPRLVHRLDKDTSGIMVIGRTPESTALLHSFFRTKTENAIAGGKACGGVVKRKYWALVIGTPKRQEGLLKAALKKVVLDGGKSEAITIAKDGKSEDALEAVTEYRVMGPSVHGCTWLELHPLTGRKHQIRVHCAQVLGMPIVGDYKYGRLVNDAWREARSGKGYEGAHQNQSRGRIEGCGGGEMVAGCVTSQTPFLHLHSRLLALPEVKELTMELMYPAGTKTAFANSLRLLAPLPPHMKASWILFPPTTKNSSHMKQANTTAVVRPKPFIKSRSANPRVQAST